MGSVWQHGDSVVVLFANARIQNPAGTPGGSINFTFNFDGSNYGLSNYLSIQKLTPYDDGEAKIVTNSFTQPVSLNNLEQVAYLISMAETTGWNGSVSTEWNNPSNWNGGVVSDSTTNVVIPAATPYQPTVNSNVTIRSLTLENNAEISVANGVELEVMNH